MKKIIVMLCSMILSVYSYGQISVESNGNVSFGTSATPLSPLSIGYGGSSTNMVSIKSKKQYGLTLTNQDQNTAREGVSVQLSTLYAYPKGISSAVNGIYEETGSVVKGVEGATTNGYKNLSIYGLAVPTYRNNIFSAAIYGATSTSYTNDTGLYAGYFAGNVKVTGLVNGHVVTPSTTSNSNGIIQSYSVDDIDEDESVVQKLHEVKLLKVRRSSMTNLTFDEEEQNDLVETLGLSGTDCNVYKDELPETSFSLAADQLRNVYPELVYEDEQGNLTINYTEMVPLLVQSINELQSKIDRLENGYNVAKHAPRMDATNIVSESTDLLSLSQNDPNPFSSSTSISMNIPTSTSNAHLVIYDMTGKQLRQIEITGRGKTSVTLTSEGLTSGMYLYALIADGQVINTKRMILN